MMMAYISETTPTEESLNIRPKRAKDGIPVKQQMQRQCQAQPVCSLKPHPPTQRTP